MLKRERQSHVSEPSLPLPAPLPGLSEALSRRAALFGAVTATGFLGAAAADAAGLLPGARQVAPAAIGADAALVDLAGRVERLSRRCNAVDDRRATLEDRLMVDGPPRPVPPPGPPTGQTIVDTSTETQTVLTITNPKNRDPAWDEWERAKVAAADAYERDRTAMAERLGLPEVCWRSNRMWCRLHRWTLDLVDMQPATPAGLAAKASAMLSLIGPGRWAAGEALTEHNELAVSVLRDAAALGQPGSLS